VPGLNRLALDATITHREELRHTPGGIPAVAMTLAHRSRQLEADGQRDVECELHAVAFGAIAQALDALQPGAKLHCEGFIARRYRTGTSVALHLTRFEKTQD
jgi:primosomal replication protein N